MDPMPRVALTSTTSVRHAGGMLLIAAPEREAASRRSRSVSWGTIGTCRRFWNARLERREVGGYAQIEQGTPAL